MNTNNKGMIVTGGSVNADQIAVGKGAQAIKTTYRLADELEEQGKEDLSMAIRELLKSLEANKAQLSDYDDVTDAVEKITEEIKKDKPSKLTLKGLLSAVKESVGSVVEIVEKIGSLQKAIAVVTGISVL